MAVVMEAVDVVSHNLPYIAAGAGAYAGALSGRRVHDEIAGQRQALVHELGEEDANDLVGAQDISPNDTPRRPLREYLPSPVFGALATVYAIAGFAIGSAVDRDETPRTVPPRIEYVVPMSGPMGSAEDKDSPISKVLEIGSLVKNQDNVETEAVLTRASEVTAMDIDELPESGLGAAPLSVAIDRALEEVRNSKSTQGNGEKANAALVVATADSSIGSAGKIIKEANSPDIRAPVYFVDVSNKKGGESKVKLEKVADQTGGKYVGEIGEKDISDIADNLQEAEIDTGKGGIDIDPILLAVALGGAAFGFRRNIAPKLPLQYHGKQ